MTEQAIRSMVAHVLIKRAFLPLATADAEINAVLAQRSPKRAPGMADLDAALSRAVMADQWMRQLFANVSAVGTLSGGLAGPAASVPGMGAPVATATSVGGGSRVMQTAPKRLTSPQKEGFPWGTLAKWALIAALLGGGLYGGYKLYNWMTKPAPKRRRRIVEEIDEDEE